MKQLIDFLPLIAFFVGYKFYDIYVATAAIIVATIIQIIATKLIWKKVEKVHLITLAVVVVFGSLTLLFHNDLFIKWKVTVIYLILAGVLIIGQLIFKKPLLQELLGKDLTLSANIYMKLGYAWAIFFSACGIVNIYYAFYTPLETWVNFKVFGLTIATFVFAILQAVYIFKHLPKETNPTE